jgi:hypothetical protein
LSTRAVAFFGAKFVCAQAGEAITRTIANTSFFIGFSRGRCAPSVAIEPDRPADIYRNILK